MSFLASVVAVYAIELVLVSFFHASVPMPAMLALSRQSDKSSYAARLTRDFGNHIDTRSAEDVLAAMRKTDADAIPVVTPSNHLFFERSEGLITSRINIDGAEVMPLASASGRMTLLCNESGAWISFRSDRRGFSNPDSVADFDDIDIAALGDSFAQGYCVPPEQAFVGLIRQRHPRTLNLAVAGDGPLLMLATLSEYLPAHHPKVVLWFYFEGNDLTDLQLERKSPLLASYMKDGFVQPALARQREVDDAIVAEIPRLMAEEQEQARRRSANVTEHALVAFAKLTELRKRLGLFRSDAHEAEADADFDTLNLVVFREILYQAKNRTERWGGTLYFVYLPDWARFTRRFRSPGDLKRAEVLRIAGDVGIPIIDLEPAFRADGDPLSLFPFREQGHYIERGHRLVADEILRQLARSSLGSGHGVSQGSSSGPRRK